MLPLWSADGLNKSRENDKIFSLPFGEKTRVFGPLRGGEVPCLPPSCFHLLVSGW